MEALDTSMSASPNIKFWGSVKEKYKKIQEEFDETQNAFEFLLGMFQYEGLPDSVKPEFLELFLLTGAGVSIRKDSKGNGDYIAMMAAREGSPDAYGLGDYILSRTLNGHTYQDKIDSDEVAFGYNNMTRTACMDAFRLGNYIAEIDTSIDLLVWWSRASKLFVASDNKTKTMLEQSFAALKKGVPLSIQSENLLAEYDGKKGLESFDLSDVDYADKLDKLAYIREKRFDWFKDRYGMPARDTAKKAQVSIDEANGGTGSAMIIPLNMLHCRQKLIDECNAKFGWSAKVHFAGAWLGEMERYETTVVENGDLDIDGYDAIEEGVSNERSGEEIEPDNKPDGADEGSGEDQNRPDDQEQKETTE